MTFYYLNTLDIVTTSGKADVGPFMGASLEA